MFRSSTDASNVCRSRLPRRASKLGDKSVACSADSPAATAAPTQNRQGHDEQGECAHSKERRVSLTSKRTLQLLNRAIATEKLRAAAPLWSFKRDKEPADRPSPTIAAASREQAVRLYAGPTVRSAGNWEARHDSPGPQAYNEGEKWRDKFKNVPSVRIDNAMCERDVALPSKPGPGDYDIAHHGVGQNGSAVKFGGLAPGKRYPPRTPDQPQAEIPCSYAEPDHVSCLHDQLTSDRTTSPAVFFGEAPRFQDGPKTQRISPDKKPATAASLKSSSTTGTEVSIPRPGTTPPHASPATDGPTRRGKKRKKRRRGGPQIFRRGNYSWLTSCVEPKQWEPRLKLLGSRGNKYDGNGDPLSTSILVDPSRARALTEKNAPRPVLRWGQRHNQSEYNPQHRDLPREKDRYPGPKYDRPPGAFARTGGGGGTTAPSASVSTLDRFPRGRLFAEEEMREREATPGPEAYDVGLGHRLEGHALEVMQGSLETLASWSSSGVLWGDGWPCINDSEIDGATNAAAGDTHGGEEVQKAESGTYTDPAGRSRDEEERASVRSEGKAMGKEDGVGENRNQPRFTTMEHLEGVARRTTFGRSRSPCFAGGSAAKNTLLEASKRRSPASTAAAAAAMAAAKENYNQRRQAAGQRHCSRLSPASSVAAWRGVPCPECLASEVAATVQGLVTAAASLSDANLTRRARTTGASFRFGDMPRQRNAPALSIGKGQRDAPSRLLHDTPAEIIYKEARLGRSGKGPTTASPRTGETVTKPRPTAALVVLPQMPGGGGGCGRGRGHPRHPGEGDGHSGANATTAGGGGGGGGGVGGVEASERGSVVVDEALGAQQKSGRPTSPSFSMAGPRQTKSLFHERLRYNGKELSVREQNQARSRTFFNAHIPTTLAVEDVR